MPFPGSLTAVTSEGRETAGMPSLFGDLFVFFVGFNNLFFKKHLITFSQE